MSGNEIGGLRRIGVGAEEKGEYTGKRKSQERFRGDSLEKSQQRAPRLHAARRPHVWVSPSCHTFPSFRVQDSCCRLSSFKSPRSVRYLDGHFVLASPAGDNADARPHFLPIQDHLTRPAFSLLAIVLDRDPRRLSHVFQTLSGHRGDLFPCGHEGNRHRGRALDGKGGK